LPDTAASKTIWRDGGGAVVAFGGVLADSRWMTVLGVGSFVFGEPSEPIVCYPDSAATDELVADAYRRTVLPLALQALGSEILHASAVSGPKGVLALCAVSGTGKSTLAYALSTQGFPLWSDDAVQFKIRDGGADALPLPFALRLKEPSVAFFGDVEPPTVKEASTMALAAIYVLERGAELELTRLSSVDAFPAVLTHAYYFDLDDADRKREMMNAYLQLVSRVPVFRLVLPEGLPRIEEVVDAIREAA
jgi:hypothetical protein